MTGRTEIEQFSRVEEDNVVFQRQDDRITTLGKQLSIFMIGQRRWNNLMEENKGRISNCERDMNKMRLTMEKFMEEISPLKNVGLQIKVLQAQMKNMDERMRNNATREDVDSCREESRLARIRTDETAAGLESIRKELFNTSNKINCMETKFNSKFNDLINNHY